MPHEHYNLTSEDKFILSKLLVPIPSNEAKRIETLRQSKLLENDSNETGFNRFTSLASRLFDMPYSCLSFVEVDRVFFKSKIGLDYQEIPRNDWFDSYTILPENSEVYVIADCTTDSRFKEKPFVKGGPKIKFYAGAAIMIDNLKIGVLSIMDVKSHKYFSLEDKENLLDLGAAAAQLAREKLQTALNLSAERANIVVSMMHHLRTPMTSLNFATSLLCNDVQQIKADISTDQDPTSQNKNTNSGVSHDHKPDGNIPLSVFNSFESSFSEINTALNQLNILVDSSLSLGQAIIKCSANDIGFPHSRNSVSGNINNNDPRNNKFSECNIIDYLTDMFKNHLPIHNNFLEIEWVIDTAELTKGTHVTFPDAIMLIVISTVSHMSTESNNIGFYFQFVVSDEEDVEYPELMNKMIEGKLSIKVFAKDLKVNNKNNDLSSVSADSENGTSDLPSRQNFLSIDKILRAINGSSKESVENISQYCGSDVIPESGNPDFRTVHEFFVPCKVLLHNNGLGAKASELENKKLILNHRPNNSANPNNDDKSVSITYKESLTVNYEGKNLPDASNASSSGSVHPKPEGSISPSLKTVTIKQDANASEDSTPQSRTLRVLVVEDTIPVQKLLTRWLKNHNCIVTCASNGKIGLDCLMTNTYDIAFIDFLMPVMLGITTMKLFREWMQDEDNDSTFVESNRQLLIVGMSATALESEQEEAFNYGMHFFCPKPVSLDLLLVILNAKREFFNNDDAINRICEVTGTAQGEHEQSKNTTVPSEDRSKPDTNPDDTADSKDASKMKWNLFRSHKQSRKVHPDAANKDES